MIQVYDGDGEQVVIETEREFLLRMSEHDALSKPARSVCLCFIAGEGYSLTDAMIIYNAMRAGGSRTFPGLTDPDRKRLAAVAGVSLRMVQR